MEKSKDSPSHGSGECRLKTAGTATDPPGRVRLYALIRLIEDKLRKMGKTTGISPIYNQSLGIYVLDSCPASY